MKHEIFRVKKSESTKKATNTFRLVAVIVSATILACAGGQAKAGTGFMERHPILSAVGAGVGIAIVAGAEYRSKCLAGGGEYGSDNNFRAIAGLPPGGAGGYSCGK